MLSSTKLELTNTLTSYLPLHALLDHACTFDVVPIYTAHTSQPRVAWKCESAGPRCANRTTTRRTTATLQCLPRLPGLLCFLRCGMRMVRLGRRSPAAAQSNNRMPPARWPASCETSVRYDCSARALSLTRPNQLSCRWSESHPTRPELYIHPLYAGRVGPLKAPGECFTSNLPASENTQASLRPPPPPPKTNSPHGKYRSRILQVRPPHATSHRSPPFCLKNPPLCII